MPFFSLQFPSSVILLTPFSFLSYGYYSFGSVSNDSVCLSLSLVLTEVSSIEWEFINMTEQEEDLIYRMYKLVGDR